MVIFVSLTLWFPRVLEHQFVFWMLSLFHLDVLKIGDDWCEWENEVMRQELAVDILGSQVLCAHFQSPIPCSLLHTLPLLDQMLIHPIAHTWFHKPLTLNLHSESEYVRVGLVFSADQSKVCWWFFVCENDVCIFLILDNFTAMSLSVYVSIIISAFWRTCL